MTSKYVYDWLKKHPLIKLNTLCKKIGVDQSNFVKGMKSGKELKPEVVDKLLSILDDYGFKKIANFQKVLDETPQEVKNLVASQMDELDNEEIQKQIAAIRAEKIPDHRNTSIGKRVWLVEQSKKIEDLRKQLK